MSRKNKIVTDVLVVGSGPAGATVARFLAAAGRQVTMIDIGPQMRKRPGEHLLNCYRYQHEPNLSLDEMFANREVYSVPVGGDDLNPRAPKGAFDPPLDRLNYQNPDQVPHRNMPAAAIMYAVGGMFSLWSGFAPTPVDFERTSLIKTGEWDSTIDVAKKLFNVNTQVFKDSAMRRAIKKVLNAAKRPSIDAPMAVKYRNKNARAYFVDWTGVDTILGVDSQGRLPANLTLLEEHRAEKLVLNRNKGNVEYTLVQDLKTLQTVQIHADVVFVCGGSFLTPQLLWNSNIRPDALGRYLTDNPVATCNILLSHAVIDELRNDSSNPARGETIPIARNDPPPKLEFPPTRKKPWIGHTNRTGRTMLYDLKHDVRLGLSLSWYGRVQPVPENRITFSNQYKDRFGMPQITIEYRLSQDDMAEARLMLADLTDVASKLGVFAPMSRPPFTAVPSLQPAGTALHLMGMTRMGEDDRESVVDTNCRVWGVKNLYVAGQSVIPNDMISNPTLAACAIAIRSLWKGLGISLADLRRTVGLPALSPKTKRPPLERPAPPPPGVGPRAK